MMPMSKEAQDVGRRIGGDVPYLRSVVVQDSTAAAGAVNTHRWGGGQLRVSDRRCLDKGYDYDQVRELLKEFGFTAHIRGRGEEARAIKKEAGFRARRGVVERTHIWMNRFRRILIRWQKKAQNYIALLHRVCAIITYRATGLFG
jgi:transposase